MAGRQRSATIAALGVAWFWFSQATSIIGLIGIVEDLRTWAAFATWLMERANALAPALGEALAALGAVIHAALEAFRAIFRPLLEALLGWLPFTVPQVVKDGLVVAVFMGMGAWRVYGHTHAGWGRLIDKHHAALHEKALTLGMVLSPHQYGPGSVGELSSAIDAYWWLRGVPFPVTNDDLRAHYEKDVAASRQHFGAQFDTLAEQSPPREALDPEASRLLAARRLGLIFVFALAAVTILIVAYDFFSYQ